MRYMFYVLHNYNNLSFEIMKLSCILAALPSVPALKDMLRASNIDPTPLCETYRLATQQTP